MMLHELNSLELYAKSDTVNNNTMWSFSRGFAQQYIHKDISDVNITISKKKVFLFNIASI